MQISFLMEQGNRGSDLTLSSPVWRRKPERGVLGVSER